MGMVNRENLLKIARTPIIRAFLKDFAKMVLEANGPEDYAHDPRKLRFDLLIMGNDICRLKTSTYQEDVTAIYKAL